MCAGETADHTKALNSSPRPLTEFAPRLSHVITALIAHLIIKLAAETLTCARML